VPPAHGSLDPEADSSIAAAWSRWFELPVRLPTPCSGYRVSPST